ncbi:MAG: biopolymer transporter ExbD [Acidobacteriota bacterium]|jgi:biopolymer transport protein ExbD
MRIKRKQDKANIPTASMADIAFLLIIFFMVTSIDQPDKTSVFLPSSMAREEIPRGASYISIDREGMMRFTAGKEPSQLVSGTEEIYYKALQLVAFNPQIEFIIKAEKDMEYRYVDEIIDALRRAKAGKVWLLTSQETVD